MHVPEDPDRRRAQIYKLPELAIEPRSDGLSREGLLLIKRGYIGWNICQKGLIRPLSKINFNFLQVWVLIAAEIVPGTGWLFLLTKDNAQEQEQDEYGGSDFHCQWQRE
jgi:hypothetical protein